MDTFDKRTENQQHTLNPMNTVVVCITYKTLISCLAENTVRVLYKDRPVKLLRKTAIAYCVNHKKKIIIINRLILYWPNEQVLDVIPTGTNSYHWALKG